MERLATLFYWFPSVTAETSENGHCMRYAGAIAIVLGSLRY